MTPRHRLRVGLWLAATTATVLVVFKISQMVQSSVLMELMDRHPSIVDTIVFAALALQACLMAIPFVPAAEIGMALLSTFGAAIAVEVYLATVIGLLGGFCVGRLIPVPATAGLLRFLCLTRAADWLDSIAALPPDQIAPHLVDQLEPGLAQKLLPWRYLALVLLINTPGNFVIGGGGGIALAAGMSRLFNPFGYLVSVLVAVLPVPLSIILMSR